MAIAKMSVSVDSNTSNLKPAATLVGKLSHAGAGQSRKNLAVVVELTEDLQLPGFGRRVGLQPGPSFTRRGHGMTTHRARERDTPGKSRTHRAREPDMRG
jgi:hypothetical protein